MESRPTIEENFFDALCSEIWLEIFAYFNCQTLAKVEQVSKAAQQYATENFLWKKKVKQFFSFSYQHTDDSWKNEFKKAYQQSSSTVPLKHLRLFSNLILKEDDIRNKKLQLGDIIQFRTWKIKTSKENETNKNLVYYAMRNERQDLLDYFHLIAMRYAPEDEVHLAVIFNQFKKIDELVTKQCDINAVMSCNGFVPLSFAVIFNNLKMVKLLIEKGASVNLPKLPYHDLLYADSIASPIHLAMLHGHHEIVRLLLQYGPDLNDGLQPFNLILENTVAMGHAEVIQALLDYGLDLTKIGNPLLQIAIDQEDRHMMKVLLANGARIDNMSDNRTCLCELKIREGFQQIENHSWKAKLFNQSPIELYSAKVLDPDYFKYRLELALQDRPKPLTAKLKRRLLIFSSSAMSTHGLSAGSTENFLRKCGSRGQTAE